VSFFDVKDIGDLKFQPLTENDAILKETFVTRGMKFVELQGTHYLEYDGYIMQPDSKFPMPPFPAPLLGSPSIKHLRFEVLSLLLDRPLIEGKRKGDG
jgi:hypothetical protein